jgi:hypothetical protein
MNILICNLAVPASRLRVNVAPGLENVENPYGEEIGGSCPFSASGWLSFVE